MPILAAGADFSQAALEATGAEPVDTGLMTAEGLNETFRKAVEGLGQGEVSEVVSLASTHVLLYVAQRLEAGVPPFEEVRELVRESFLLSGEQKLMVDWVERLRQNAEIEIKP